MGFYQDFGKLSNTARTQRNRPWELTGLILRNHPLILVTHSALPPFFPGSRWPGPAGLADRAQRGGPACPSNQVARFSS